MRKAALDITEHHPWRSFSPADHGPAGHAYRACLAAAEKGMIITDATTGQIVAWTGSRPDARSAPTGPGLTAAAPLNVTTNNLKINPGTAVGDLLTWDGVNWVNTQPAVQHFSFTVDNHQPYLVNNYVIGLFGIFPSRNTANQPFVGEIYLMGCNFAPQGFATCDGSLINISTNTALFSLLGTQYGGDGQTTFAVPDLRGRVPVGMGQGRAFDQLCRGAELGGGNKDDCALILMV